MKFNSMKVQMKKKTDNLLRVFCKRKLLKIITEEVSQEQGQCNRFKCKIEGLKDFEELHLNKFQLLYFSNNKKCLKF